MGGGWKHRGNVGGSPREEMQTEDEEIGRDLMKKGEMRAG